MMKWNSMWAGVILAGMVLGGSLSAAGQCEGAIKQLRDSWIQNWNNKNLEKVVELYTSDAVYLTPDGDRLAGRDNIRATFQKAMSMNVTDKVDSNETRCSDSIASDMGTYTETLGDGTTHQGAYLVVLRKESGKWRLYGHSANLKMGTPAQ